MAACSRNRSGGGHRQRAAASVVCVDTVVSTRDARNIDVQIQPGALVLRLYTPTVGTSHGPGRGHRERARSAVVYNDAIAA